MDLYINRSKAIQKFRQIAERNTKLAESTNSDFYHGAAHAWSRAALILSTMRIAEVQPVTYAHKTVNVGLRSYCSNCGELAYMEKFCTKCGAKVNDNDKVEPPFNCIGEELI